MNFFTRGGGTIIAILAFITIFSAASPHVSNISKGATSYTTRPPTTDASSSMRITSTATTTNAPSTHLVPDNSSVAEVALSLANANMTVNGYGQGSISSASAGFDHTVFLSTGSAWASGRNNFGQLGDGTEIDKVAPMKVMSAVQAVAAGAYHTVFLKHDGSAWSCGDNSYGQLADNTSITKTIPVKVMLGVMSVAAGVSHTVFIKTDHTAWSSGNNGYGQLVSNSHLSPVHVMSGVLAVAVGSYHTVFLKLDGTVWSCGRNDFGQLGDATTEMRYTPVRIMSDVRDVIAGAFHSVFVKFDSTAWSCGANSFGQTGVASSHLKLSSSSKPIYVMSQVQVVSAHSNHTVFVKRDGTAWSCGSNEHGQLGDGALSSRTSLVQVMSGVLDVATGASHTIFLKSDGVAWSSGRNDYGQLGDGSRVSKRTPSKLTVLAWKNPMNDCSGCDHNRSNAIAKPLLTYGETAQREARSLRYGSLHSFNKYAGSQTQVARRQREDDNIAIWTTSLSNIDSDNLVQNKPPIISDGRRLSNPSLQINVTLFGCRANYAWDELSGDCRLCDVYGGVRCAGGLNAFGGHRMPESKSGHFLVGFLEAVPCKKAEICLGGIPWVGAPCETNCSCAEGFDGFLCETCAEGWTRADPEDKCHECTGKAPVLHLVFRLVAGLVASSAVYIVLSMLSLRAGTNPQVVHIALIRMYYSWVIPMTVLKHIDFSSVEMFHWVNEATNTRFALEGGVRSLENSAFPEWFQDVVKWLFIVGDFVVTFDQPNEIIACLTQKAMSAQSARTWKHYWVALWWVFYPVLLMLCMYLLAALFVYIVFPFLDKLDMFEPNSRRFVSIWKLQRLDSYLTSVLSRPESVKDGCCSKCCQCCKRKKRIVLTDRQEETKLCLLRVYANLDLDLRLLKAIASLAAVADLPKMSPICWYAKFMRDHVQLERRRNANKDPLKSCNGFRSEHDKQMMSIPTASLASTSASNHAGFQKIKSATKFIDVEPDECEQHARHLEAKMEAMEDRAREAVYCLHRESILRLFKACFQQKYWRDHSQVAKCGFKVGDKVSWENYDDEIPAGSEGLVIAFIDGEVQVQFPNGTWNFNPLELRDSGETTRLALNPSPPGWETRPQLPSTQSLVRYHTCPALPRPPERFRHSSSWPEYVPPIPAQVRNIMGLLEMPDLPPIDMPQNQKQVVVKAKRWHCLTCGEENNPRASVCHLCGEKHPEAIEADFYEIMHDSLAVTASDWVGSADVYLLRKGAIVEVVEVKHLVGDADEEACVRGRIEKPAEGWISLLRPSDGHCWATKAVKKAHDLAGDWEDDYGCYEIYTKEGEYVFKEGIEPEVILRRNGDWWQGYTANGIIRLQHCEDDTLMSQFKRLSESDWDPCIIAHRTKACLQQISAITNSAETHLDLTVSADVHDDLVLAPSLISLPTPVERTLVSNSARELPPAPVARPLDENLQVVGDKAGKLEGLWACPKCGEQNKLSRSECNCCNEKNPEALGVAGTWSDSWKLDIAGDWSDEEGSYRIYPKDGAYMFEEKKSGAEGMLYPSGKWWQGDIKVGTFRVQLREDGSLVSQFKETPDEEWTTMVAHRTKALLDNSMADDVAKDLGLPVLPPLIHPSLAQAEQMDGNSRIVMATTTSKEVEALRDRMADSLREVGGDNNGQEESRWTCPKCGEENKQSRSECNCCNEKKPEALDIIGDWSDEEGSYKIFFKDGQYIFEERNSGAEGVLHRNGDWWQGDIKIGIMRVKLQKDGALITEFQEKPEEEWHTMIAHRTKADLSRLPPAPRLPPVPAKALADHEAPPPFPQKLQKEAQHQMAPTLMDPLKAQLPPPELPKMPAARKLPSKPPQRMPPPSVTPEIVKESKQQPPTAEHPTPPSGTTPKQKPTATSPISPSTSSPAPTANFEMKQSAESMAREVLEDLGLGGDLLKTQEEETTALDTEPLILSPAVQPVPPSESSPPKLPQILAEPPAGAPKPPTISSTQEQKLEQKGEIEVLVTSQEFDEEVVDESLRQLREDISNASSFNEDHRSVFQLEAVTDQSHPNPLNQSDAFRNKFIRPSPLYDNSLVKEDSSHIEKRGSDEEAACLSQDCHLQIWSHPWPALALRWTAEMWKESSVEDFERWIDALPGSISEMNSYVSKFLEDGLLRVAEHPVARLFGKANKAVGLLGLPAFRSAAIRDNIFGGAFGKVQLSLVDYIWVKLEPDMVEHPKVLDILLEGSHCFFELDRLIDGPSGSVVNVLTRASKVVACIKEKEPDQFWENKFKLIVEYAWRMDKQDIRSMDARQIVDNAFAFPLMLFSAITTRGYAKVPSTSSLVQDLTNPKIAYRSLTLLGLRDEILRVISWLGPELLSRSLGIAGRSTLSLAEFHRMVCVLEPGLSLEQFQKMIKVLEPECQDPMRVKSIRLKKFFDGADRRHVPEDAWCNDLIRSVASRAQVAWVSSTDSYFDQFVGTRSWMISPLEFERILDYKQGGISREKRHELWKVVDVDRNGELDLFSFYSQLRQFQIELSPKNLIETRMVQFRRRCLEHHTSAEKVFSGYDDPQFPVGVDRSQFKRIFADFDLSLDESEWSEFEKCRLPSDKGAFSDKGIDYRELLRHTDIDEQSKAMAKAVQERASGDYTEGVLKNDLVIGGIWNKAPSIRQFFAKSVPLLFIALYSVWHQVTVNLLALLRCRSFQVERHGVIESQRRWLIGMSWVCYEGDHLPLLVIGIIGLVFWGLGIFAFLAWQIFRNQSWLSRPESVRCYTYFVQGYQPRWCFWEILVKRLDILCSIIIFSTEVTSDDKPRILLCTGLAGVMLLLQARVRPFDQRSNDMLNRLEYNGLWVRFVAFSIIVVLLIFSPSRSISSIALMMLITMVVVHLGCLLALLIWDTLGIMKPRKKQVEENTVRGKLFGAVQKFKKTGAKRIGSPQNGSFLDSVGRLFFRAKDIFILPAAKAIGCTLKKNFIVELTKSGVNFVCIDASGGGRLVKNQTGAHQGRGQILRMVLWYFRVDEASQRRYLASVIGNFFALLVSNGMDKVQHNELKWFFAMAAALKVGKVFGDIELTTPPDEKIHRMRKHFHDIIRTGLVASNPSDIGCNRLSSSELENPILFVEDLSEVLTVLSQVPEELQYMAARSKELLKYGVLESGDRWQKTMQNGHRETNLFRLADARSQTPNPLLGIPLTIPKPSQPAVPLPIEDVKLLDRLMDLAVAEPIHQARLDELATALRLDTEAALDGMWTGGSIAGTKLTFPNGEQTVIDIIACKQFVVKIEGIRRPMRAELRDDGKLYFDNGDIWEKADFCAQEHLAKLRILMAEERAKASEQAEVQSLETQVERAEKEEREEQLTAAKEEISFLNRERDRLLALPSIMGASATGDKMEKLTKELSRKTEEVKTLTITNETKKREFVEKLKQNEAMRKEAVRKEAALKQEMQSMGAEKSAREKELTSKREEVKRLSLANESMKNELVEKSRQIEVAKEEATQKEAEWKRELQSIGAEKSAREEESKARSEELRKHAKEVEDLAKQNKNLMDELADKSKQIDARLIEFAQKEAEKKAVMAELEEVRKDLEQERQQRREEIAQLEAQHESAKKEFQAEMEKQEAEKRESKAGKEEQLAAKEELTGQLEEVKAQLENERRSLGQELSQLKRDKEAAKEEMREALQKHEAEKQQLEEKVKEAQAEILAESEKHEAERKQLENKFKASSQLSKEADNEKLEATSKELQAVQAEKAALERENKRVTEELNDAKAEKVALEKERKEVIEELDSAKAEKVALERENKEVTEKLVSAKAEKAVLERRNEEVIEELDSAKAEKNGLEEEKKRMMEELTSRKEEVEELTRANQNIKDELMEKSKENEALQKEAEDREADLKGLDNVQLLRKDLKARDEELRTLKKEKFANLKEIKGLKLQNENLLVDLAEKSKKLEARVKNPYSEEASQKEDGMDVSKAMDKLTKEVDDAIERIDEKLKDKAADTTEVDDAKRAKEELNGVKFTIGVAQRMNGQLQTKIQELTVGKSWLQFTQSD